MSDRLLTGPPLAVLLLANAIARLVVALGWPLMVSGEMATARQLPEVLG